MWKRTRVAGPSGRRRRAALLVKKPKTLTGSNCSPWCALSAKLRVATSAFQWDEAACVPTAKRTHLRTEHDTIANPRGQVIWARECSECGSPTNARAEAVFVVDGREGAEVKSYHPDDPKLVANWFDPHDLEHLRAWQEAQKGWWPEWFQEVMREEGIEPHQHWSTVIRDKMADLWVEHKTGASDDD